MVCGPNFTTHAKIFWKLLETTLLKKKLANRGKSTLKQRTRQIDVRPCSKCVVGWLSSAASSSWSAGCKYSYMLLPVNSTCTLTFAALVKTDISHPLYAILRILINGKIAMHSMFGYTTCLLPICGQYGRVTSRIRDNRRIFAIIVQSLLSRRDFDMKIETIAHPKSEIFHFT